MWLVHNKTTPMAKSWTC